mmetsp:Transcript_13280/g.19923  ORF Transcript_13280/g.19923 Transcript_13280/m.19923 type:complete len:147 (+) Transcript_13280:217-657(+)
MSQNGLSPGLHIPHTWGTDWHESFRSALRRYSKDSSNVDAMQFRCRIIFASDILLYVSAYESLVATLLVLFTQCQAQQFVMAWNRRIAASQQFFELMRQAGFHCARQVDGRGVFVFTLPEPNLPSSCSTSSVNDSCSGGAQEEDAS